MSDTAPEQVWRPEVVPGERVFLSHVQRADLPLLTRWFSDLETTTYLGALGRSFTLEDEQDWFERVRKAEGEKQFGIVVREGRRLIGTAGLMRIDHQRGVAELGISIGDKSCWGQGYGTETVRLLLDYGFTFLGLHTIFLWYSSFNARGQQAYLKAGFKPAGRLRGAGVFDGRRYDHVLMDITRDEFGPSRLRGMIGQLNNDA
ncbi:MAG TPA: GNAT family protein [Roseiflexaceae bacterium]|nr:GNAT family protein [Roseiflexaceae bacterium]